MMMNWPKLIDELLKTGATEAAIAAAVTERGAEISQASINRLKSGAISEPKHSVGEALLTLHAELHPKPRRRKTH